MPKSTWFFVKEHVKFENISKLSTLTFWQPRCPSCHIFWTSSSLPQPHRLLEEQHQVERRRLLVNFTSMASRCDSKPRSKKEFMQPSVFDVTKLDILIFDISHCQGAELEPPEPLDEDALKRCMVRESSRATAGSNQSKKRD
ncbi:unnamed protein product [Cladocopium goreaui]|uniref:Uncharacterized protein n=1 Tax=Cladocopium goreaui TaxID=2562237 RepID=A0A9P1BTJ2_9DINO|nr:unnamed protein product [Cladocopium goreaui]